ncbi:NB-ARC domain containing protein, partial [Trema orientale]
MAELVGEAFLSSLFQTIFERITSPEVVDFFWGRKLNDELLKQMEISLLSANALLNDAEKKQIIDPDVKCWLEELKEVILEAEELLDEIKTEDLRCKLDGEYGSSMSKRLRKTYSCATFEKTVERRIVEILERLKFIVEQKDLLGLEVGVRNTPLQRLPAPLLEESSICGRDYDKECIVKLLLSNDISDNKISVISIVGMGGIGKTTLAQLVFDDSQVREHFDIKAWITVSDDFDIFKITKEMFQSVTSQNCNTEDLYQLQVKLKWTLMGKKFLFVYDDVWNEDYDLWDVVKSPLESGAPGSKIILTTRSEIVALNMGNCQTYMLQAISDEDCWRLFAKHVFYDVNLDAHSDLQGIGREIVQKCKGLPLAIKSLAGHLRSVRNPEEWRSILNNDIWELQLRE